METLQLRGYEVFHALREEKRPENDANELHVIR